MLTPTVYGPPLSARELCELEYEGPQPAMQGFAGEDARTYHREHGVQIRAWQGYLAPEGGQSPLGATGPEGAIRERNGRWLVPQVLAPDVRVLVWDTHKQVVDEEHGVITVGSTQISAMPDELQLSRGDRVLFIEPQFALPDRCLLDAGETLLTQLWVSGISRVMVDGAELGESDYDWQVLEDGRSHLTLNAPYNAGTGTVGTCSVEFRYQPFYVWNDLQNQTAQMGTDGVPLPQIGELTQLMGV